MNTPIRPMTVLGSQNLTVDNTVGGVALTLPAKQQGPNADDIVRPSLAYITNEAQEIRWSIDSATAVTTTENGHTMASGGFIWVSGTKALSDFRAIRTGGSSGTLHITYFA